MVAGTLNHVSSDTHSPAVSVRSMPHAKAPSAPWVGVCESLPTMNRPGLAKPSSGST